MMLILLCKFFIPNEVGQFFVYFLTSVVVGTSCNSDLIEESNRAREEIQSILDNK